MKKTATCVMLIGVISAHAGSVQAAEITYLESTEDISNPDRGFYYPYTTRTSDFRALDTQDLLTRRVEGYRPYQADYQVKSSIGLRHYVLDSYVNLDQLAPEFLRQVQADFDIARAAGVRLILRFSHTTTRTPGDCAAESICPPYGDAPKSRVLGHIIQLAPVLKANADVIMGLQQGFVGTWGEGYYTDYFGDASENHDQGYLTNQNWNDRNEVVGALLAALPEDRMLQLRIPQAKQRFLYGPTAPTSTSGMGLEQAFSQTNQARLGFHNDCFLASDDDFGTFADYGNDDSPQTAANSLLLKAYSSNDGTYTLVGGETCADEYNPQNNCESAQGMAVSLMESYHYSYLNSDYNNAVNNDWVDALCMDDIKRRLGYRLVLMRAEIPAAVVSGQALKIAIELENKGFAAPVNPRQLWLVLRNVATNIETKFLLEGENTNPQLWLGGSTNQIQASAVLHGLAPGDYSLLLHLADPSSSNRIVDRTEFSIRFANLDIWESTTGYNSMNATIKVHKNATVDDFDILDFIPAILSTNTD